jgi:hypothetical protein
MGGDWIWNFGMEAEYVLMMGLAGKGFISILF